MDTANSQAAKSVYTYQAEPVDVVLNATELINEHRDAVEQVERGAFCPDREFYQSLEDFNRLVVITVRHNDVLVGYQFTFIQIGHHQKDVIQGIVDCIYVCPQHRGACGRNLIEFVSTHLYSIGVTDIYHFIPVQRDWSPVLKRMGYKHIENVMHKGL